MDTSDRNTLVTAVTVAAGLSAAVYWHRKAKEINQKPSFDGTFRSAINVSLLPTAFGLERTALLLSALCPSSSMDQD